jgi:hypothetical protein
MQDGLLIIGCQKFDRAYVEVAIDNLLNRGESSYAILNGQTFRATRPGVECKIDGNMYKMQWSEVQKIWDAIKKQKGA